MRRGAGGAAASVDEALEGDLGFAAGDEVRGHLARAAGHRPSDVAVAGVEVEVLVAGPGEKGNRGRGHHSTPSGSSASRLAMYSRRASSTASSIGGGS